MRPAQCEVGANENSPTSGARVRRPATAVGDRVQPVGELAATAGAPVELTGRLRMSILAGSTDECDGPTARCEAEPACNLAAFADGALRPDDPAAIKVDICETLDDAGSTVASTVAQLTELLPEICP